MTLSNLGRHEEAQRTYRAAFDIHLSLLGERHWRTVNVARNIGRALALQQRYADALTWMDRVMAALDTPDVANDPDGLQAHTSCERSVRTCSFD